MKRAGICLLAVALACSCGRYNREAVESNNQGMQFLRAGRFSDARERFQRAAEEDRNYDLPLYNLALAYIRQRDWANAADALTRAIARQASNADYHYQLGNAHYQIATAAENADNAQGGAHLEQARAAFQVCVQRNPNYYMAHFRLGQVAELLDNPQDALREYSDTLRIAPRAFPAYARLARVYLHQHLNAEAAQTLREGLRVAPPGAPERGQMHAFLGSALLAQNQALPATEEFQAAINEDEQLTEALFNLGMTYADMPDRRQQAILYLTRFIAARGGTAPREFFDHAQQRLNELQTPGQ